MARSKARLCCWAAPALLTSRLDNNRGLRYEQELVWCPGQDRIQHAFWTLTSCANLGLIPISGRTLDQASRRGSKCFAGALWVSTDPLQSSEANEQLQLLAGDSFTADESAWSRACAATTTLRRPQHALNRGANVYIIKCLHWCMCNVDLSRKVQSLSPLPCRGLVWGSLEALSS